MSWRWFWERQPLWVFAWLFECVSHIITCGCSGVYNSRNIIDIILESISNDNILDLWSRNRFVQIYCRKFLEQWKNMYISKFVNKCLCLKDLRSFSDKMYYAHLQNIIILQMWLMTHWNSIEVHIFIPLLHDHIRLFLHSNSPTWIF